MDEKDVVVKMQNLIGRSNLVYTNNKPSQNVNDAPLLAPKKTNTQDEWLDNLPKIDDDCFLLDVLEDDNLIIFCVKELDWQTAMNIDMKSFRSGDKNIDYYSEEYERRQTLAKAIVWVADSVEKKIVYNENEQILEFIEYEVLDTIWDKYKAITSVTTQEAQKLYEFTRKYLNGEAQEGIPIPAIIPETIAICDGWCTLSAQELRSLTAGEWERMQIIKMARADLMGVYTPRQISSQTTASISQEKENLTSEETSKSSEKFDFKEWAYRFPKGHPNRPPEV